MSAFRIKADRALEVILAALMGLLVLDVLWQVFTRFVLGDASSFTEEAARFLLIWISLLGAAYVTGKRRHLAIDLLPQRFDGVRRRRIEAVIDGCILFFALVVLVGGGTRLVWVTLYLGQSSAALGLPLGVVYAALPISGGLMALYTISDLVRGRTA